MAHTVSPERAVQLTHAVRAQQAIVKGLTKTMYARAYQLYYVLVVRQFLRNGNGGMYGRDAIIVAERYFADRQVLRRMEQDLCEQNRLAAELEAAYNKLMLLPPSDYVLMQREPVRRQLVTVRNELLFMLSRVNSGRVRMMRPVPRWITDYADWMDDSMYREQALREELDRLTGQLRYEKERFMSLVQALALQAVRPPS